MKEDSKGQYFIKHPFIALRDEYHSSWRISRITINPDTSLTLTYVDTAFDKMDAEQKMDKMDESDSNVVSENPDNWTKGNTDDVIRPLYYV
jgi:hypothetical protein